MLNGKRVFSKWYEDPQDAYQAALRMRKAAFVRANSCSLGDGIDQVLAELRTKRTAGTVRWYADHFAAITKKIPTETSLARVTPAMLEQFVRDRLQDWAAKPNEDRAFAGRRVLPSTVNADLRALNRVFAIAIRRGQVDSNPVRQVDRPRADRPAMDWFTLKELGDLLDLITVQADKDLLQFFALTGIRRSEAERLLIGHVRVNARQLVVPGKNAVRVVPLAEDVDAALERLVEAARGESDAAEARSRHLIPGGLKQVDETFRRVKAALKDRRVHPHALRHTFGTALIRAGERPDVVMRLMGHRSINTTLRYLHEAGDDAAQAVRSLRLVPPPAPARESHP